MDLLENKTKLKKNPPKPIFVYNDPPMSKKDDAKNDKDGDDLTLEELENAYKHHDSEVENVFSDHTENNHETDKDDKEDNNYQQKHYDQQEEEEEDEEEKERKEKAELLFSFMVLRRKYPAVEIPEFTEHSDMDTMKRVYEQIIRRVSLDSSVENYKQYLMGGFMILEWVSTNWMAIDLSGFARQQNQMMGRYERLLIELGEKNYSTAGSRFPVEVRLIFFVLFNAGMFYVQKMIFSGGDGGNVFNTLLGGMGQPQVQPATTPHKRRGKMNGPTITPNEVEELTRKNPSDSEDSPHGKSD
jgi:hypothetical protein